MKPKKQSADKTLIPKAKLLSGSIDKEYLPIPFHRFLEETVKGKTPADMEKKFRDYLRNDIAWQASMGLGSAANAKTFDDVGEQVYEAIDNYRKNGIPREIHCLLDEQFKAWWKKEISRKARENRQKRAAS